MAGERGKAIGAAVETARRGTLAQAEAALAMLLGEEQEVTDIFYTQQYMIESLTDLLAVQDQQEQVTYVSPPAPLPRSTNYLLYAGLAIAALFYFGKIKL